MAAGLGGETACASTAFAPPRLARVERHFRTTSSREARCISQVLNSSNSRNICWGTQRMHTPGWTRPARPRRCCAEACEAYLTLRELAPTLGSYSTSLTMQRSTMT